MNIVVCIKQVPNTPKVKIDMKRKTIVREGVPTMMNPLDRYAVETALQLKEKHDSKIFAFCMGPLQSEEVLREAIAMGIDKAYLLSDPRFAGADTLATSYTLATAIKKIVNDFDLIVCGSQTTDSDTGQVGPQIAEELGIPHVAYVEKIKIVEKKMPKNFPTDFSRVGMNATKVAEKNSDDLLTDFSRVKKNATEVAKKPLYRMIVDRISDKFLESLEVTMPALITVGQSTNQPRYTSILGIEESFEEGKLKILNADDIGADLQKIGIAGSATTVIDMKEPEHRKKGETLTGTSKEIVEAIINKLVAKEIIIKKEEKGNNTNNL